MVRPALVCLFAASGCAALVYEVVWFQLLQLVIGSSSMSLGVLLATFMGGTGLGSVLLPRWVSAAAHPLRVYALLELTIALCGGLLIVAWPLVDDLYAATGGSLVVRLVLAGLCLLPPTMAMGATLPAVARVVDASRGGLAWLGWFYAGNIAGAVVGTLVAAFYLLRVHDVVIATMAAATLNVGAAAIAWFLAGRPGVVNLAQRNSSRLPAALEAPAASRAAGDPIVHVVIALSGLTALAAQVLWTRVLALAFGATVYTFALILAAFLTGLGLGSAVGAAMARSPQVAPRVALAWMQLSACVAIGWASYLLAVVIPYWMLDPASAREPASVFRHDLTRALVVVLPGALAWGASFPLALACLARPGRDTGQLAGGAYGANTAGCVAGALLAGALLLPAVGSEHTQQVLVAVAGFSGVIALVSARSRAEGAASFPARASTPPVRATATAGRAVVLEVSLIVASVVLAAITVLPVPAPLIAYGRQTAEWAQAARVADAGSILYTGEGRHDFIAVSRGPAGQRYYHAAGKVQASTVPEDLRLQLLLAHLSHLVPATPARVLVIGCGAGITAGALGLGPGVERMTIAEIEPLAPVVAAAYFGDDNHHILDDPRVSLRIDDGRHVLATSADQYDVITTDLIDPWVKGVAALFTREFFELAKRRLRPGGVVTQFVQLYQSSPEAVKSEIATFVDVFPDAIVWGNPHEGQGYDLVLLGQAEPRPIDVDALQARLGSAPYDRVRASLGTIGVTSAVDLLAAYAGRGRDLAPWLRDAAISRDRDLRLQYLAGLGLDQAENANIYREMLGYARFSAEAFSGRAETLAALSQAVARRRP